MNKPTPPENVVTRADSGVKEALLLALYLALILAVLAAWLYLACSSMPMAEGIPG